jgi:hypothetical protein
MSAGTPADTSRMAVSPLLDLNALTMELAELERAEVEISAVRRRLHVRLDSFPNELTQRRERVVSDERQVIHRRIDELRAQLGRWH